jgi:transposase
MPVERISMRKISEVLRLHFAQGLSGRAIARSISAAPGTVQDYIGRAKAAGLGWPLPPGTSDEALEAMLYPSTEGGGGKKLCEIDFAYVRREMKRKGVTLMLLWQEYKLSHPDDGYQYSQFCHGYRKYEGTLDVVMRQDHRAGEKMFADFSGDGIPVANPETGEVKEAALFVSVLGASSYVYAEAFAAEDLRSWITGHIHSFEYFKGAPAITVPDNPKAAVTHPCRYEPDINPTFLEMATHYGTAVIPARVRKPRDKAKVESSVLIAQRWILAALRNHVFFSLSEANAAIAEQLEAINTKPLQKLGVSRKELWETLDRPALLPLPEARYEFADWSVHTVNIDYHVEVDRHYYSVPYNLVRQKVDVRMTASTVEILHKGRRVASHRRSTARCGHTTEQTHMPMSHQQHLEWSPERIIDWASKTGPRTAELAGRIMALRTHPEQGYRSCLGIIRLEKDYGKGRLEGACARALEAGAYSFKSVRSILKNNLDRQLRLDAPATTATLDHENLRGPGYYH